MSELVKDILYRLADDDLIIGHRNSEWTGMGPVLEEDIAFASMAQDQIGHAQSFYRLLHDLGEQEPDQVAFNRKKVDFRSCHFVEWPIQDYAFSLVRHFLYDSAKYLRLKSLQQSSYTPLAELSSKLIREVKYPVLHAKTWIKQLGSATEESRLRMQSALNEAYPMAMGLFEPTPAEEQLHEAGIAMPEAALQTIWQSEVEKVIQDTALKLPEDVDPSPFLGGRQGLHSEHLGPLLKEMTEVFALDTKAKW